MKLSINLEAVRDRFAKLPESVPSLDEIEEGARVLYTAADDGTATLNTKQRDAWLVDLDQAIEGERLRDENATLKLERDSETVWTAVRSTMARNGVRPGLLDGAASAFLREHKVALGDDGKVYVTGKRGAAECAVAVVNWMSEAERQAAFNDVRRTKVANGAGIFASGLKVV